METKAVNQYEKDLKSCEEHGINPTPFYSGCLLKRYDKKIKIKKKTLKKLKLFNENGDTTDYGDDCEAIDIFNNWSKQTNNIMVPIEMYKADFYARELGNMSTRMNTDILQQLTNISSLVTNINGKIASTTANTIVNRKKLPTMCELNCIATKGDDSDFEDCCD